MYIIGARNNSSYPKEDIYIIINEEHKYNREMETTNALTMKLRKVNRREGRSKNVELDRSRWET